MFDWLTTIFEIGLVIGVIYGLYYIAGMFPNLGQAGRDATHYLDLGLAYMNNQLGACGLGGNPSDLSCDKDTDCTTSGICGTDCKCDTKKNTCYQDCKSATDCIQGRGITCDDNKCSGPRSFLPGGAFNSGCWIGWSALSVLLGWLLLTGKGWTGMKWAGNKMVDFVKYASGGKDYRQYRDSLDTLDKILDAQEGKNLSEWSAKAVAKVHELTKTRIEQYNRRVDQWNKDHPDNPFNERQYTDKDMDFMLDQAMYNTLNPMYDSWRESLTGKNPLAQQAFDHVKSITKTNNDTRVAEQDAEAEKKDSDSHTAEELQKQLNDWEGDVG